MFTAEEFRGSIMFNCGVVMGKQSFKGSLKKRAQGLGNFCMKVMAARCCGSWSRRWNCEHHAVSIWRSCGYVKKSEAVHTLVRKINGLPQNL